MKSSSHILVKLAGRVVALAFSLVALAAFLPAVSFAAVSNISAHDLTWPLPEAGTVTATMTYSDGTYHGATDIWMPRGTSIIAADDGVVTYVQTGYSNNTNADGMEAYGNMCIVYHPDTGLATYYGHMDTVVVSQGQKVERGEKLGTLGDSGRAFGEHLHFEVRTGESSSRGSYCLGTRQNPLDYVTQDNIYTGIVPSHKPCSLVEGVEGGSGTVHVWGWLYDGYDTDACAQVRVRMEGDALLGEGVIIEANLASEDVNDACNIAGAHRFDATIPVVSTGDVTLEVYAVNMGEEDGTDALLGSYATSVCADVEAPIISNIAVTSVSSKGYTVTCDVADNAGLDKIEFSAWAIGGNSDSFVSGEGTVADGKATFWIETEGPIDLSGCRYTTTLSAYDYSGNMASLLCTPVYVPSTLLEPFFSYGEADALAPQTSSASLR